VSEEMIAVSFDVLVSSIRQVHEELAAQASRAVNMSLTLRNWLIGFYIAEYEQKGVDRAQYGDRLLDRLSGSLLQAGVSRAETRELRRYRQFYTTYPQIRDSLTPELKAKLLPYADRAAGTIRDSLPPGLMIPVRELITKLSFTHIAELLKCDDAMKRGFYEIECVRGNWSVRELQRQINSLYYERSGLSNDKKRLAELAHQDAERAEPKLTIRDPYIFEFLGLKAAEVMSESALEDELLDELQAFLLELGHGFCFEARQKRILIGDSHNFVDLVFYHRVLKCHVLVELKLAAFSHENIGQLNTYVSWYRKNMMTEGDNPPVGILLCTHKDHALVEYALAGMENGIFVSKYLLELPQQEEIQRFIEAQLAVARTHQPQPQPVHRSL
jgi:predicted nuclease of restriction endonuclease-like (RecB) superfamily